MGIIPDDSSLEYRTINSNTNNSSIYNKLEGLKMNNKNRDKETNKYKYKIELENRLLNDTEYETEEEAAVVAHELTKIFKDLTFRIVEIEMEMEE